MSTTAFFNLCAVAEPYASVKVTHGTPCTLFCESSDVCDVETTDSFLWQDRASIGHRDDKATKDDLLKSETWPLRSSEMGFP